MLICGDIALPYENYVDYTSIPNELKNKVWFGNLEGSLIDVSKEEVERELKEPGVFNSYNAIKELISKINFRLFGLANNHILDRSNIDTTTSLLNKLGVKYIGAGRDIVNARKAIDIYDEHGEKYTILAFGWDCISCQYADSNHQGVNPITKKNILKSINEIKNNSGKIICFFHWNYELELYPQPYERSLAKLLIDKGVYAVIGCHAHRPQGIEFYKGRPIVYGLGNFLFPQKVFFNEKLEFPPYASEELVFELGENNSFSIHQFKYDKDSHSLMFVKSIKDIKPDMDFDGKAIFSGYDDEDYLRFFRKNRIKKKLLPVFTSRESILSYTCKSGWVKLRNVLINIFLHIGLKTAKR